MLLAQAVAGPAAVDHMQRLDGIVRSLASLLKAKPDDIPARVAGAHAWTLFSPLGSSRSMCPIVPRLMLAIACEVLPAVEP